MVLNFTAIESMIWNINHWYIPPSGHRALCALATLVSPSFCSLLSVSIPGRNIQFLKTVLHSCLMTAFHFCSLAKYTFMILYESWMFIFYLDISHWKYYNATSLVLLHPGNHGIMTISNNYEHSTEIRKSAELQYVVGWLWTCKLGLVTGAGDITDPRLSGLCQAQPNKLNIKTYAI